MIRSIVLSGLIGGEGGELGAAGGGPGDGLGGSIGGASGDGEGHGYSGERGGDEDAIEARALATSNVAGFVVVQDVSIERQAMTVLAPSAAAMPSLHLVNGGVKWMEH